MKKGIILSLLLVVVVASMSFAEYWLCAGVVYNSQQQPVPGAYVLAWAVNNPPWCNGNYTRDPDGYFEIRSGTSPHTGWYKYCATKSGVGKATTSIYHTEGVLDTWYPTLSGDAGLCECETPPNDR